MIDHRARIEDIRFLAETGETATRAAARLGTTFDALEECCRAHNLTAEWNALRSRGESAAIGHVRRGSVGLVLA